jgi:chromosome segregation ATPase
MMAYNSFPAMTPVFVQHESLQATYHSQRSHIARLENESHETKMQIIELEKQCDVLESVVRSQRIVSSHQIDKDHDLAATSRAEWMRKNEAALISVKQLEADNHNLKTYLEVLKSTSGLPNQGEIVSNEIKTLERKAACSELDIFELTVRIADLRAISEPLAQQIEEARLQRSDMNTKANRLRREISEALVHEQDMRNEVRASINAARSRNATAPSFGSSSICNGGSDRDVRREGN